MSKLPSLTNRERQLFLAPSEAWRLNNALPSHWRTPFLISVSLGLRAGETWGLRRKDIDLENGELTVAMALKDIDGKTIAGPTKNHQRRTLSIDEDIVAALREILDAPPLSRRQGIRRGRPSGYPAVTDGAREIHWTDDHRDPTRLIFTTRTGQPVKHGNVYAREFRPVVAKLWPSGHRLHDLRWHDLRHSAAAYFLAVNPDLYAVMARLGHSDIGVTTRTYGHLLKEKDQKISRDVSALLQAARAGSNVVPLRPTGSA